MWLMNDSIAFVQTALKCVIQFVCQAFFCRNASSHAFEDASRFQCDQALVMSEYFDGVPSFSDRNEQTILCQRGQGLSHWCT
ncbi:hypothetical protein D3C76_1600390 [compost metagenome]